MDAAGGCRPTNTLYLRQAAREEIVITRHGQPAAVLIGFQSEEDWFEYRLEHHPEFLQRVAEARAELAAGRGIALSALKPRTRRKKAGA